MGSYSASSSDQNSFAAKSSSSVAQSGQHGQFLNFAFGHGNSLTPTNTDSSGGLNKWILLGAAAVGLIVFYILKRKG